MSHSHNHLSFSRVLLSTSVLLVSYTVSLIGVASAAGANGLFGDYFGRMTGPCASGSVLTGFDNTIGSSSYGTKTCTPLSNILGDSLGSLFSSSTAPTGQAVIGFTSTGALKFGSINWIRTGSDISYMDGNVGIGVASPGAKLDVAGLIRSNVNGAPFLQGGDDVTLNDVNIANTLGIIGIQDQTRGVIQLGNNTSSYIAGLGGNIGIGTYNPQYKLDVNGDTNISGGLKVVTINLNSTGSTALICNADNEGTIRYNKTSKKFEGCNGTEWSELGTGGTYTNPNVVYTDSSLSTVKTTYTHGEKLYAYVEGGDPTNTWACMEHPGAPTNCSTSAGWRQLTKPYEGRVDDWQYNPDTSRIELKNGFLIEASWPAGEYRQYIRTGTSGTPVITRISLMPNNPKSVFTDSSLSTKKSIFTLGESLYGYIEGGDPNNTWACMDIPGASNCLDRNNWRQLTKPYAGQVDDWQYNSTTKRIELRGGFYADPTYFPVGVYKGYVANGRYGTADIVSLTLQGFNPPSPIFTDSTLSSPKVSYTAGELLYGYIEGGDPNNTWACTEYAAWGGCESRSNWRQLTKPYAGQVDDWQYNASTKRIELRNGFATTGFPIGSYRSYVSIGQYGSAVTSYFTLESTPVSCRWAGQAVFGPVGTTIPDHRNPSTCTSATNGTYAIEQSTGSRQIAKCICQ